MNLTVMFRWSLALLLHKVFYNSIMLDMILLGMTLWPCRSCFIELIYWMCFHKQVSTHSAHESMLFIFSIHMAFDKGLELTFLCWSNWNSPSQHRKDVRDEDKSAPLFTRHCQNAQWWCGSKGQHKQAICPSSDSPHKIGLFWISNSIYITFQFSILYFK